MPPRLAVALHPSRLLAAALAACHTSAVVVACVAIASGYVAIPLACVVACHGFFAIHRHALLRNAGSLVAIHLRGATECTVLRRDGGEIECRIGTDSYVSTWLTVLQLEQSGRRLRRYIVLAPDSSSAESLRRLRVRLRWSAAAGERREGADTWL